MRSNYKTIQRKIVMDYLINNKDKFVTADEILKYIEQNGHTIGLTTIYRLLNLLEKNNNLRVDVKNHTKYYQYVLEENSNHLFLKCKKCGKSMNLDCKTFENVKKNKKKEHNFNLDYNTIIYGTCNNCSK